MQQIIKLLIPFLLAIASVFGSMVVHAEQKRDIKLTLGTHNYDRGDSIKLQAKFVGFSDDPIVKPVIAEITDYTGRVIAQYQLDSISDDTFSLRATLPEDYIQKHEDILKLHGGLSIQGPNICGDGFPVIFFKDDVIMNPYFNQETIKLRNRGETPINRVTHSGSSWEEFKKVPIKNMIGLIVFPSGGRGSSRTSTPYASQPNGGQRYIVKCYTKEYFLQKYEANCYVWFFAHTVRIIAETKSGEVVACFEPISMKSMWHRLPFEEKHKKFKKTHKID